MNNKLFVVLALVALAIGATGYIVLNPASQRADEATSDFPFPFGNRTGMPRFGNRTNMFTTLLEIINASEDYSEILEYITNTTKSMNSTVNTTNMPHVNFTNPFTELFSELEEDIQGYIDNETPLQDVKEQMILKIEEFLESMTQPEPPQGWTPLT